MLKVLTWVYDCLGTIYDSAVLAKFLHLSDFLSKPAQCHIQSKHSSFTVIDSVLHTWQSFSLISAAAPQFNLAEVSEGDEKWRG